MALSTETQNWLNDLKANGGLTDEAFNAIKAGIDAAPGADKFVKESALRQSDYSRVMAEIQTAKTALATKEAAVTAYQGELGTWKAGAEAKFNTALQERERAQVAHNAALARLQSLAVANGLDVNEVLKDLDVTQNTQQQQQQQIPGQQQQQPDMTKYLTVDQLNEQVSRAARESALVDATMYDLSVQHRKLFGVDLPSAEEMVTGAIAAKTTLKQFWETKYGVPAKRVEVAEAAVNTRVQTAVDEALAKERSEAALRGGPHQGAPGQPLAPVFTPKVAQPIAADHQSGGGISAALAAHSAGKYRGGVVHQS